MLWKTGLPILWRQLHNIPMKVGLRGIYPHHLCNNSSKSNNGTLWKFLTHTESSNSWFGLGQGWLQVHVSEVQRSRSCPRRMRAKARSIGRNHIRHAFHVHTINSLLLLSCHCTFGPPRIFDRTNKALTMAKNPIFAILWLLLLWFIAWPLAGLCAGVW